MRNLCQPFLLAVASAVLANAQVTQYDGVSTNFGPLLDFDNPAVPLGPISANSPVFLNAGIESVTVLGTWQSVGDVLSPGVNVHGNTLVVSNGVLQIAQVGDPLDGPSSGAGLEFQLTELVDEFGMNFNDLFGFRYGVELFDGNTSVGMRGGLLFAGGDPRPGVIWRGEAPFERVIVDFSFSNPGFGFDEIGMGSGPPHVPYHCVETTFVGTRVGSIGGTLLFQLETGAPTTIEGLFTHFDAPVGDPVGLEVYTCNGSFTGKETNPAAWTQVAVDDGTTLAAGLTLPTKFTFAAPLVLPAGTRGIALVAIGSGHRYSRSQTGSGFINVFTSADGNLKLINGSATSGPFSGTLTTGRNWDGRLCASGPLVIGMNYCTAVPNSTGSTGTIGATGSTLAEAKLLTLTASNLPNNEFGFFVTSRTPGFFPGTGGASDGNLCLGGALGRLNQPGQILSTGASGEFELEVDTTMVPELGTPQTITAGETWHFQAWHRDSTALGSNFTDGIAIGFL